MRAARICIAATSLCFIASASRAQSDQVPKELALALIPYGANEGGEIVVGQLPPDLAANMTLPPGARVLGSFMSLGYGQSVIAVPIGSDSAIALLRRSLLEHGWTAREQLTPRSGGLQFGPRGSIPSVFCKAGVPQGVSLTTQFYGRETLVRLTRSALCGAELPGRPAGDWMTSVSMLPRDIYYPLATVPPLWSPGDPASSMRACRPPNMTGVPPYQSQDQVLRTELSAQAVLDYYGKQLDSAGWKPVAANESVARTWTKTTGTDTTQDVTLAVSKSSTPGCYEIDLRASARRSKR